MTDTDPRAAFNAALIAFQKELPHVGKDSRADIDTKSGKGFGYSYADLTAITTAAFPLLTKHGLAFTAKPTVNEAGTFVLRYELKHSAGHCDGGDFPLSQGTMQQIGSAITYARRYALCAVTGIAPGGEDDDGAKASESRPEVVTDPVEVERMKAWTDVASLARSIGWTPEQVAESFAGWSKGLHIASADGPSLRAYHADMKQIVADGKEHKKDVAAIMGETLKGQPRKDNKEDNRRGEHFDAVPADEFSEVAP